MAEDAGMIASDHSAEIRLYPVALAGENGSIGGDRLNLDPLGELLAFTQDIAIDADKAFRRLGAVYVRADDKLRHGGPHFVREFVNAVNAPGIRRRFVRLT
jgi:hypothetical protein